MLYNNNEDSHFLYGKLFAKRNQFSRYGNNETKYKNCLSTASIMKKKRKQKPNSHLARMRSQREGLGCWHCLLEVFFIGVHPAYLWKNYVHINTGVWWSSPVLLFSVVALILVQCCNALSSYDPVANSSAVVVVGNARFTVLTRYCYFFLFYLESMLFLSFTDRVLIRFSLLMLF